MTAINVRLTEKEKTALEQYGKISDIVRDAIRMYINNRKSAQALKRLKEYQKENRVATTTKEIVSILRKDRNSR